LSDGGIARRAKPSFPLALCAIMKTWIAILTSLHVLAHGVFGCCDHGPVVSPQAVQSCSCHHEVHDHLTSSPDSRDAADQGWPSRQPHQCVHASCHWVVGDSGPSVKELDFSAPISIAAFLPAGGSALPAAEFWPDAARGTTSAPPLRLHLALGVLLI